MAEWYVFLLIKVTYAQTLRAKRDIREFSSTPHFTNEKTETQISKMICLSHGLEDLCVRNINCKQWKPTLTQIL